MSLKEKLTKLAQEAEAKAKADKASAQDAMKRMAEEREQSALTTVIALLEDSNIESLAKIALDNPILGKKVHFVITNGTIQAITLDGMGSRRAVGLGHDFPYSADPIAFQQATRHHLVQTRISELLAQGVIATFPNVPGGSPPIVAIDLSGF